MPIKFFCGNIRARLTVYSPLPQASSSTNGLLFLKKSSLQRPLNGLPASSCTTLLKVSTSAKRLNLSFPKSKIFEGAKIGFLKTHRNKPGGELRCQCLQTKKRQASTHRFYILNPKLNPDSYRDQNPKSN